MIQPPPTSTLFPYTTLFRSLPILPRISTGKRKGRRKAKSRSRSPKPPYSTTLAGTLPVPPKMGNLILLWDGKRDRKSTRLNSSHVEISYAVFCLKKKKKQKN